MPASNFSIAHTFRRHWREYAMEAMELGMFMASACLFSILLFYPSSPVAGAVESEAIRRLLMGIAMGATAIALIYSPMGQRSGAHMNPAVTLTYWRLGKIENADALGYIAAQFIGAILGMTLMGLLLGEYLAHPAVHYVATVPGMLGLFVAWAGEFTIALLLMLVVLHVSNSKSIARYTGLFAGGLVAAYIFIEAPLSGMSMNPARTFGSSLAAQLWTGLWIYFTAPPLAMLLASEIYLRSLRGATVYCAKLNHFNNTPCIFRCRFHEMFEASSDGNRMGQQHEVAETTATQVIPTSSSAAGSSLVAHETLYFG